MTEIVAIDPGTTSSAIVVMRHNEIANRMILDNENALAFLSRLIPSGSRSLVVEMMASYGMPVGRDVFRTCVWIGRFIEATECASAHLLTRGKVKMHLCCSMHAKDSNIRQALIDRFGGSKELAIGTKKSPGPLYGFKKDMWAALAVAVTFADKPELGERIGETS